MKNLLIYLHPRRTFDSEGLTLVKIQIDNSLDLGWDIKDIVLVTNFEYEYRGVQAIVAPSNLYCAFRPKSTKTVVIEWMLKEGMIEDNQVYWMHDFDAYQLEPFDDFDPADSTVFITTYGWSEKWCSGSYFFTNKSATFFNQIVACMYQYELEDERALGKLLQDESPTITQLYKVLNITYNFGMRQVERNYEQAVKPIKVVHFHPYYKFLDTLGTFMHGKNGLGIPLMTDRLIKLFNSYDIK